MKNLFLAVAVMAMACVGCAKEEPSEPKSLPDLVPTSLHRQRLPAVLRSTISKAANRSVFMARKHFLMLPEPSRRIG